MAVLGSQIFLAILPDLSDDAGNLLLTAQLVLEGVDCGFIWIVVYCILAWVVLSFIWHQRRKLIWLLSKPCFSSSLGYLFLSSNPFFVSNNLQKIKLINYHTLFDEYASVGTELQDKIKMRNNIDRISWLSEFVYLPVCLNSLWLTCFPVPALFEDFSVQAGSLKTYPEDQGSEAVCSVAAYPTKGRYEPASWHSRACRSARFH